MDEIAQFGKHLYAYCTEFVINLANILNLSYYEVNFIIFCVLYPLLLIVFFVLYLVQRRRLKRMRLTVVVD